MMPTSGILRKCRCRTVWCPTCWGVEVRKHAEELRAFDWKRVREVVLTVDPKKFKDGREAFEYVTRNKLIAGLVRNLTRGMKERDKVTGEWLVCWDPVNVIKWKWFLEWHKDGFPHWHLFLETDKAGAAGMIGGARLRHYWPTGSWVYESYVKGPAHWKEITGYFGKNGYFNPAGHKNGTGKAHQGKLPEWALLSYGSFRKIRRSCSSVQDAPGIGVYHSDDLVLIEQWRAACKPLKKSKRLRAPAQENEIIHYRMLIRRCGMRSKIRVWNRETYLAGVVAIPYADIKKRVKGEYIDGVGYSFKLSRADFEWIFQPTLILKIDEYRSGKNGRDEFTRRAERIFEKWWSIGIWQARKHYGWSADDYLSEDEGAAVA